MPSGTKMETLVFNLLQKWGNYHHVQLTAFIAQQNCNFQNNICFVWRIVYNTHRDYFWLIQLATRQHFSAEYNRFSAVCFCNQLNDKYMVSFFIPFFNPLTFLFVALLKNGQIKWLILWPVFSVSWRRRQWQRREGLCLGFFIHVQEEAMPSRSIAQELFSVSNTRVKPLNEWMVRYQRNMLTIWSLMSILDGKQLQGCSLDVLQQLPDLLNKLLPDSIFLVSWQRLSMSHSEHRIQCYKIAN